MTDAERAYAKATAMIAEALADGRERLDFDNSGTRALEALPPQIADLTALRSLDCDNTQMSDLSPLSGLTGLTRLWLNGTAVSDVSPLSGLTDLTELWLNLTAVSDLSPLSGLTDLTGLWLNGTAVSDVSPLSGLTGLTVLELTNTAVSDLSPLSGLTGLTKLWLTETAVSDFTLLSGLTGLTELFLSRTAVSDLSPLSGLTGLTDLELIETAVSDVSPLSGLTGLTGLWLHGTTVSDLRPLLGVTSLVDGSGRFGLQFRECAATRLDARIAEISEIVDSVDRGRALFAYLEDWEPPGEKPVVPVQQPAPVRAVWLENTLVEAPIVSELEGRDDALAREGWEALKEFFDDVETTLRKDNLPNLSRAIDAFGRALGSDYGEMRPIAVGTHGQRIIEISKSSDAMLLEDASGDLMAFAAVISTMLQRFKSWHDFVTAQAMDESPLSLSMASLRDLSATFGDADDIAPDLAQKFDDLLVMAEDADVDPGLAQKGILASASNILAPIAEKVVAYCKDVGGKTREYSVKTAAGGIVGAAFDLFFNKGQILAKLAADHPAYLGWIETVLRMLGKI